MIDKPTEINEMVALIGKLNHYRDMYYNHDTSLISDREYDFRTDIPELSIPAFFISGEKDYNCPWELVEDYCDRLQAPDKAFYLIPDSAHSPLWENAEVTCGIMREIKERTSDE